MARIRVVTDSTADIPAQIVADLGITVVPCHVHFGKQTFLDGVDLRHDEFLSRLRQAPPFPKTAPPPTGVFVEAYRAAAQEADQLIAIHLSSALSGLYNVARLAIEMLPELTITLLDSRQISMCTGWLVIMAARAARAGASAAEIVALVQSATPRLRLLAVVCDLHYLQRSGRVNWVTGMLGTMLQVKPLILVQDGQVKPVERVRSYDKALLRLEETLLSYGPLQELAVIHLGAPDVAGRIAADLAPRVGFVPLITEAGVIIGAHAGPEAVGVACVLAKA
jgi:DegV family protein with EDD domain